MPGSNLRFLTPIKKLSGPIMPAQANLNYWFKVDGDAFLPNFMLDRSPNGIPDPNDNGPGQRGRMVYGDPLATALVPNAINGKDALQIGGTSRCQPSLERNSPVFAPYYEVTEPFSAFVALRSAPLDATNNFIILPEIAGTIPFVNNFVLYIFLDAGVTYAVFCPDSSGVGTLQAIIPTTAFDNYSTMLITYNGLGFDAANFTIKINNVSYTVTTSTIGLGSGNGGCFYGSGNNTPSVPTGFLLESAMWNKVLDSTELTELNDYTVNEYGLVT